jgi:hypothetical protein
MCGGALAGWESEAGTMEVFGMSALFGLILGFMFGVGCAFAVLYTIYMGGYRKAIADSLKPIAPAKFQAELEKARTKTDREKAAHNLNL